MGKRIPLYPECFELEREPVFVCAGQREGDQGSPGEEGFDLADLLLTGQERLSREG
jgi:hypothetical protein